MHRRVPLRWFPSGGTQQTPGKLGPLLTTAGPDSCLLEWAARPSWDPWPREAAFKPLTKPLSRVLSPDMGRPVGFSLLTVGMALVGIGLIIARTTSWPATASDSLVELEGTIGEALLVAALLAGTVDRYVKARFAKEVGRDVAVTLFGISAPEEYVRELHNVITATKIIDYGEWWISLEWLTSDTILKVTIRNVNRGRNISNKTLAPSPLWLRGSVPGRKSHFLSYSVETSRSIDKRAIDINRFGMEEEQLAPNERIEGGAVRIDVKAVPGAITIGRGDQYRSELTGRIFCQSQDVLPLIQNAPTLRQSLHVSGGALSDLRINVWQGIAPLQPGKSGPGDDDLHFAVDGLALRGQPLLLSWDRRVPPQ
jgi:hypothetical protein